MSKSVCLVLLAIFSALAPFPASAQSAGESARPATAVQQRLHRGSKIIGSPVRDPQDNKLGVIKDLMLDARRGEIAYVVMRSGGVAGSGRKYHAIPWKALAPGDNGKFYVLHADSETLANAPIFDRRRWPDMADQKWSAEVDRYWGGMVGKGVATNNTLTPPSVSNHSGAEPASSGR